jgi:hypothetical protein
VPHHGVPIMGGCIGSTLDDAHPRSNRDKQCAHCIGWGAQSFLTHIKFIRPQGSIFKWSMLLYTLLFGQCVPRMPHVAVADTVISVGKAPHSRAHSFFTRCMSAICQKAPEREPTLARGHWDDLGPGLDIAGAPGNSDLASGTCLQ